MTATGSTEPWSELLPGLYHGFHAGFAQARQNLPVAIATG
jgi:hypothetical protein